MSRWLDRQARRLGAHGVDRTTSSPLASQTGVTRRDVLQAAAGAGVAITALSAFGPALDDASADDYCLARCIHNAENNLAGNLDATRGTALSLAAGLVIPGVNIGIIAGTAKNVLDDYAAFYDDRSRCRRVGCGDPSRYPPPPTPPATPVPVKPPGCDPGYALCGDYCCDSNLAYCQGCSTGPKCCRNGSNCCPNG